VSYPEDRLLIRDLIENWALYRDSGDWERFASVWHDGARMNATWFQGPYEDFIEASRKGAAAGVQISHFLGGMTIDVKQARAVAQTKMTISQRGLVHDVLVDVVCAGRFYDFLERRDGRWGIVRRQPIYEIDRMDPVDPAASLRLDAAVLGAYPEGYRHLAYLQRGLGFDVKAGLPERTGAAVEQLYAQGRAWLSGDPSLFKNQDPSFRTVAADSGRSANPAQPLAGGDGPLRQGRRPGGDVLRWWRSRRPGRSGWCRRPRRRYG
jgi:hypothetical protein